MKKQTKSNWKLVKLGTGKSIEYTEDKFHLLRRECMKLLELNQDEKYRIQYCEGEKVIESDEISVYFSL